MQNKCGLSYFILFPHPKNYFKRVYFTFIVKVNQKELSRILYRKTNSQFQEMHYYDACKGTEGFFFFLMFGFIMDPLIKPQHIYN